MNAAVVSAFDTPPRCAPFPEPVAHGAHELVVDVLAAGLHPRVRSQADGSHYTSTGALPFVPGIDGVGRDHEGRLRYFVLPDTTHGSMAQRIAIDVRRSVVLPDDSDPVALAAAMNPAMSAWIALRRRIELTPGQSLLVLGATGSAGRLAVQVAKRLGAGRVIAAGRDAAKLAALPALGADATVALGEEAAAADVDVVLDYLWGEPAAEAMAALVRARADRGRPLTWVAIGSVAGPTAAIPSAALRAARLQLVGSGQGSVPTAEIVAELPALAEAVGDLAVDAEPVRLADVERAWAAAASATSTRRIVITP